MRILFFSITVPFPATDGGRIRVLNLLKQLAKTEQVTFLALQTTPEDRSGIDYLTNLGIDCHLVERLPSPPPVTMTTVVRAIIKKQPVTVSRYYSSKLEKQFHQLLDQKKIDIIHYEMFHAAQYSLPTKIPALLSTQNIDSYIWKRLGKETKNPVKRLIYWTQAKAFSRCERESYSEFSAATCVSANDQELLNRACPQLPVHVIANGVDLDLYQVSEIIEEPETLIFTGSMDWYPNEDAVTFFLKSILPHVRQSYPNVRMLVVGQYPTDKLRQMVELANTDSEVIITGRVDDVKPYINQASVYVVPLRIGGGTRLKILEALALRKAVVSTTIGAEGLNLVDQQEIILADQPDQFAKSIIELLDDAQRRRLLGEKGRERVENNYGWPAIAENLRQVYQNLVN